MFTLQIYQVGNCDELLDEGFKSATCGHLLGCQFDRLQSITELDDSVLLRARWVTENDMRHLLVSTAQEGTRSAVFASQGH